MVKMETKQWWGQVDSLYDIVAHCARKVSTERLELRNRDAQNYGAYICVEASPKGFFNSVKELGGKEWVVEYKKMQEPVKQVKEPEEPKNIIKTTETLKK